MFLCVYSPVLPMQDNQSDMGLDNQVLNKEDLIAAMEKMQLNLDNKSMEELNQKIATVTSDPRRRKMCANDFEDVGIIGRGAFAEVKVVRKKDDGKIYAMKVMSKNEMVKKKQVCKTRSSSS